MLRRTHRGVHLVAVRSSEYKEVDVTYWSVALRTGEPCGPGPVDVGSVDTVDAGERLAEYPRNAERLDEDIR